MNLHLTTILKKHSASLVIGFMSFLCLSWIIFSDYSIGNDYQEYHLIYPLILKIYEPLYSFYHGWYPYMEGGVPSDSLVMGQSFHFPNWLLSLFPSYYDGSILGLFSLKHCFYLALLNIFYYKSLRKELKQFSNWELVLITFAIINTLRTLDFIRYGTSFDAAFFSNIFFIYLYQCLKKEVPASITDHVVLFVSTYLMVSSGYPTIPFLLSFCFLFIILIEKFQINRLRPYVLPISLGFVFSFPHWYPFIQSLQKSSIRGGSATLNWASAHKLDLQNGTQIWGNLFAPWVTEVHSSFAGNIVFTVVLLTIFTFLFSRSRSALLRLTLLLFPFIYSLGKTTPLFKILFYYVPGFSSFRVPGRVFVALPLIIFVSLVYISKNYDRSLILHRFKSIASYILISYVIIIVLLALGLDTFSKTYVVYKLNSDFWSVGKWIWIITSMAILIAIKVKYKAQSAFIFILCFLQTFFLFRYGTWTVQKHALKYSNQFIEKADHLPLADNSPLLFQNSLADASLGSATKEFKKFIDFSNSINYTAVPFNLGIPSQKLPFYKTNHFSCSEHSITNHLLVSTNDCIKTSKVFDFQNENRHNILNIHNLSHYSFGGQFLTSGLVVTPFPFMKEWTVQRNNHTIESLMCNQGLLCFFTPEGQNNFSIAYQSYNKMMAFSVSLTALTAFIFFIFYISGFRRVILVSGTVVFSGFIYFNYPNLKIENRNLPHSYQKILNEVVKQN